MNCSRPALTVKIIYSHYVRSVGGHLPDISVQGPQQALELVEEETPPQHLFAPTASKNDITQSQLAERFDVERKTINDWLTRREAREFESAVPADDRPWSPRNRADVPPNEL